MKFYLTVFSKLLEHGYLHRGRSGVLFSVGLCQSLHKFYIHSFMLDAQHKNDMETKPASSLVVPSEKVVMEIW